MSFAERYGPLAVIAGASEGLGAAFARSLAARGLDLILMARRAPLLAELASELESQRSVSVRMVSCDLADDFAPALEAAIDGREVGLGVYNAAYSYTGALLDRPLEDALRVVDVNVRGPLRFVHALAPAMKARGRGGLVLMSSLAGLSGSPRLAAYAASKAFNVILGESLWAELAPHGVDVLVSCAGAIRTPGYVATATKDAPGTLEPEAVAERTLRALGSGPLVIPGALNRVASFVMQRVLSRATAVRVMGRNTRDLG